MVDLPVSYFWLGKGRRKSYFNSRYKVYEDIVIEDGTTRQYLLLGNKIAEINGRILRLDTAGYDTLTTLSRLYEIVYWGNEYGYNIPLTPQFRATGAIYWQYTDGYYYLPARYPIEIDVKTGEVLTPLLRVIPTWIIQPSSSSRKDGIIKRKSDGYFIIRNHQQYLFLGGTIYRLDSKKGFWVEELQPAKIVEFI